MKETRAQVIERLERLDRTYISTDDLYILNGYAMRLIRDNQARERVLVEALEEAYTDAVLGGLKQSGRQIQQTLARINSGDWMDV